MGIHIPPDSELHVPQVQNHWHGAKVTSVHRLPCFSYTLAPYSVSDCRRGKINPFNVNMSTSLSHMHCPYCVKHYLQFPFCNIAHTCNQ